MKSNLYRFLFIGMSLSLLFACDEVKAVVEEVNIVGSVKINEEWISLIVGEKKTLTTSVKVWGNAKNTVFWISIN